MSDDRVGRPADQALFEESVEDLYDQAPCGYLSTLPDGTIVRVNQTLLDWTGHTRADLLAAVRFQTLLTVGSRIYYETHVAPLLRMQGFANEIALELICPAGRILPVVVNSRQRRDDHGTPLLTRITLFDSSDRRRYERELLLARRKAEQVAKDKADLLSMLSHDIRNPLNAVMGVVQLLERSGLSDAQKRHVGVLKSSSENMLNLLNHVLELSRAESGGFALEEVPFSVTRVVDDVRSTFELKAEEKGLELRATVDDDVPASVVGDPIAFRQILTNLVGNAVKFTERGWVSLTVRTRQLGPDDVTLDFAVADSGIGIPAHRLGQIFDEFTQASYETAVKFGGSGLGLAITRKLLARYGSKVHISTSEGEGSTFSFSLRLPIAPA